MRILCFAHLSEQLGSSSIEFSLDGPVTVQAFREMFRRIYPDVDLAHVMIAVNEQFAEEEQLIGPADTVALLPPVSGG